jgi:light-harvesting protein B-800-850 beta chain
VRLLLVSSSLEREVPGELKMNYDPNRVWPSGLTLAEAEELHRHIIDGTRVFGAIAVIAHLLAFLYSPWLG